MIKAKFTDIEHFDADMTKYIESGNTTEAIAARMLRAQKPIIQEILLSGDFSYLSGFVRGVSNIVATMIISLPPGLSDYIGEIIKQDVARAIEIAKKGAPK